MALQAGQAVFVDTSAWIALALKADPLHARAADAWAELSSRGAKLRTSIPVVLETFTFLERNVRRDVALDWKDSLGGIRSFQMLECTRADTAQAWEYFGRRDLHKLSAVDATSFAIMKRAKITLAFSFDHHFASVGFRMVG